MNTDKFQYREFDSGAFGSKGFEDNDLTQRLFSKDQLASFKDIIKNHVLENILLGIQGGLVERAAPKHLYDKELGFG